MTKTELKFILEISWGSCSEGFFFHITKEIVGKCLSHGNFPLGWLVVWGFPVFLYFGFVLERTGILNFKYSHTQECVTFGVLATDSSLFSAKSQERELLKGSGVSIHTWPFAFPVNLLHGGEPGPPRVPDAVREGRGEHLLRAASPPQLAPVQRQWGRDHLQPLGHHRDTQVPAHLGSGSALGGGFGNRQAQPPGRVTNLSSGALCCVFNHLFCGKQKLIAIPLNCCSAANTVLGGNRTGRW